VKLTLTNLRVPHWLIWGAIWGGLGLIVAGVSARVVAAAWGTIPLAIALTGGVALALGFLLWWQFGLGETQSGWRRRSLQVTSNALIGAVAMVLILGVLNVMAVRYSQQWDLSENQQFSLAPQTQAVVRSLQKPLKVWTFRAKPPIQTLEEETLLERYQKFNRDRFSFEFVDSQANPGLARKYEVRSPQQVILDYDSRTKTMTGPLTEANLTPAIAAIIRDQQLTVYFLEGHGEVPLTGGELNFQAAAEELAQQDIAVEPLNLVQQPQIPADANVLIIAGPKRPYLEPEVQLLRNYLKQGGRLFVMLNPESKTNLEGLLQAWGVTLDNRIIVDASGAGEQLLGLGPAVPVVFDYGSHPITQDFDKGFSFFPLAQAVTVTPAAEREATALLMTGEQTWAEQNPDSSKLERNPNVDRPGPLSIGVAIEQPVETPTAESATPSSSAAATRLVVLGDSDFATTGPFGQGLNGDLFLNVVNWLGGDQSTALSLRPKQQVERRLDLKTGTFRLLAVIAVLLLPLAALVGAGVMWWRRR
jgi:ABC-type uncharacterized transport system involved in gliding motility auxiliary subunit